jgi:hypothetical protein
MAKREVLGVMDCPECGMSGAEVKQAKSGLLYRWCPECNAQYFPRTDDASARLGKRAGIGAAPAVSPVTVTEVKTPDVVPVPAIKKPARAGFDFGV